MLQGSNCNLTTPDFLAAGPVSKLQGSNCNLTTPDFLATGLVSKLQGSNCNLSTPEFLAAGPVSKLRGSNCNLTTPDFLAAGPVSKLQGSNCNLTTPDFLAAGLVSKLQGSNCNLTTPDFLAVGPARGLQDSNCNLTTPDFLAAGPAWGLQNSNCNLTTPDYLAACPVWGLQDSNCNLSTPDFLAAGPVSKLQGSNCNLTTPDFLAAGPVSKLQGSNCNLTTPDFLVAGLVSKLQGSNCNLSTPDFLAVGPARGLQDSKRALGRHCSWSTVTTLQWFPVCHRPIKEFFSAAAYCLRKWDDLARFLGLGPFFVQQYVVKWMVSSTRLWFSVEMNVVVSTSMVLLSWGRTFLPGTRRLLLTVQYWVTLSGRFVSPAAVQFLWFHRFVSKRHSPFAITFCMFVPRSYSLLRISSCWPTMSRTRSAMQGKKKEKKKGCRSAVQLWLKPRRAHSCAGTRSCHFHVARSRSKAQCSAKTSADR